MNYDKELTLSAKIYTVEDIKNMVSEVMKEYDIEEAYLFGSYARSEANNKSDIDIMIKKNEDFSFLKLSSLANTLMSKLGKEVDIITQDTYTEDIQYDDEEIRNVKEKFYAQIRKEMVKIYG